jgi:arylsulfatase A-like enzyme
MVTYNDLTVGNLLSVLKRLGLYDQTIVVLLGDHGEAFGEHGFNTHSGIPYEEQTHVPLIIKLPYSKFSGISRSSIVQLTDLLPTLIDYCHLPNVEQLQGKSLRSIIEYGDGIICNDQLAFSEGKGYISARTPRWKYISLKHTWSGIGWILRGNIFKHAYWYLKQVKTMKLFDLKKDPGETQNVVFRYPKLQRTFSKCLKTYWQENTNFKTSFSHAKLELDDVVAKRLGDLGYLD